MKIQTTMKKRQKYLLHKQARKQKNRAAFCFFVYGGNHSTSPWLAGWPRNREAAWCVKKA
jgi:hypothetical protein